MESPSATHRPKASAPIGIFDSGLGGLTVVRALERVLPHERLLYLGDTARVPYGSRSPAVVQRYAQMCCHFLLKHHVKLIVVACNTASAAALPLLQKSLHVPVLGVIEAGARSAAAATTEGPIAVIGTEGTVGSGAYQKVLAELAPRVRVLAQACPMLVPLCEEGLVDHPATRLLLADYLEPLMAQRAETLLLGCTHYPLLAARFAELLGPRVTVVDSALATALATARCLAAEHLTAPPQASFGLELFATDVHVKTRQVAGLFLGREVAEVMPTDLV